ncbi:MAG: hypothetical protein WCS94_15485 [Verrucomicrobiota bacterium]
MQTKQTEYANWNKLLAIANPTPASSRIEEDAVIIATLKPDARPALRMMQMEFPFVERFND